MTLRDKVMHDGREVEMFFRKIYVSNILYFLNVLLCLMCWFMTYHVSKSEKMECNS